MTRLARVLLLCMKSGAKCMTELCDETGTMPLRLNFAGQWDAGWLCPGYNLVLLVGALGDGAGRAEWYQSRGGRIYNFGALPGAARADALFGFGSLWVMGTRGCEVTRMPPEPILCDATFAGALGEAPSVVVVHRACRGEGDAEAVVHHINL